MNQIDTNALLGDLVTEQEGYARIFERFGLDYCCGGRKTLRRACAEKGLDPSEVVRMMSAEMDDKEPESGIASFSLTELVNHIEETHHLYLREELPRLAVLSEKVASVHGTIHPELLEVRDIVAALRAELEQHLLKEEQILFPFIRQMEAGGEEAEAFHCGSIGGPISQMEFEHDSAGAALARLHALTSGYTAPSDACETYTNFLKALSEFEQDLHLHVHKENNILFPKALELEAKTSPME